MRTPSRISCGFTLIELLAVLGIVAILMALLFPSIQAARKKANAAKCVSNLRQLASAIRLYAAENNGTLPLCYGPPSPAAADRIWYQYLQYADPALLKNDGVLPNPNKNNSNKQTVYNCPSNTGRISTWDTPSYAYNGALGDATRTTRLAAVSAPARTVLFADAGDRVASAQAIAQGPPMIVCYRTDYGGATFNWQRSVNFKVHDGLANFAFVDGHVEPLTSDMVSQRGADLSLLWSKDNIYSAAAWW